MQKQLKHFNSLFVKNYTEFGTRKTFEYNYNGLSGADINFLQQMDDVQGRNYKFKGSWRNAYFAGTLTTTGGTGRYGTAPRKEGRPKAHPGIITKSLTP